MSNIALRVLQISDPHLLENTTDTLLGLNTQKSFEMTLQHALEHYAPVDFLLMTGDLAQDGKTAGYQRLAQSLTQQQLTMYCLPGNHDDPALMKTLLNQQDIHYVPYFEHNGWHFEMLNTNVPNSEKGHFKQDELTQMAQRLSQSTLPTAICMHHPPIPIGSEWLDTMAIDNGDMLYDILKTQPQVKVLLCGHVHQALQLTHKNLPLLSVPSTCIQFKPASKPFALDNIPPGYRFLTFFEDGTFTAKIDRIADMPSGINFNSKGY